MRDKETVDKIEVLLEQGKPWREIAHILNETKGVMYDESTYRKHYTSYVQGRKDGLVDTELKEQLHRIDVEKKKLSIRRGTYNEEIRDGALAELYIEEIKSAVGSLPLINVGDVIPDRMRDFTKGVSLPNKENVNIVFLSDLHYDGNFELCDVFDTLFREIVREATEGAFDRLIIVEAGDAIEGSSLRPSQMRAIKLGMIDQIIEVSEYYAQLLSSLSKKLQIPIQFHMVTESNHTQIRPLNTKRNELPDEDLMKVMYRFLKARFDGTSIFIEGEADLMLEFDEVRLFVSHGHKYNVTPNNLQSAIKEIYFYHNEGKSQRKPNFFVFGHFHHYRETTLNKEGGIDSKAFLLPALSPNPSTYERHGLLGCNPAFAICSFTKEGRHLSTKVIPLDFKSAWVF